MTIDQETAAFLDRWRDGGLDARERAAWARRLEADPQLAAAVHAELRFAGRLAGFLMPIDGRLWNNLTIALAVDADDRVAEGVLMRLGPQAPPRWRFWALAATLFLLIGGATSLVVWRQPRPGATVAMTDDAAGETESLAVVMASPLTCGDDQHAQLAFSDGSRVDVGAASSLRVASIDRRGTQVELTRGSLQAVIAKQPADAHFIVRTKEAVLTVLGTRFTATRFPWGTRVEVVEGRVLTRQLADGSEVVVPAGMRVDVGASPGRQLVAVALQPSLPAGATQRTPVADAIVIAGRRARDNRGSVPSHLLTSLDAPIDERREYYVRFALDGVKRPVASARLCLHVNHLTQVGMRLEVAEVLDATWGEKTVTWETRPPAGRVVGAWLPGQDDVPIDLTAAVNGAGGMLSLRIRAAPGTPPHAVVGFNTREAIEHKRPILVVVPAEGP